MDASLLLRSPSTEAQAICLYTTTARRLHWLLTLTSHGTIPITTVIIIPTPSTAQVPSCSVAVLQLRMWFSLKIRPKQPSLSLQWVSGLTTSWLHVNLVCHQEQAALLCPSV